MELYLCHDTDFGNKTYIVANNIKEAIDVFKQKHGYYPEVIINQLSNYETLIICKENK